MITSKLISYDIPPLKLTDSGTKALDWMEEFKVKDMPVIDGRKYVGIIEESDVLDRNDIEDKISQYNLSFRKPFVYQQQHIFDAISQMIEHDVDVLPVLDKNEDYLGLLTTHSILKFFAEMASVTSQGSIVTLELNVNDYSLAEIAKMVESDDAKILASFITSHQNSNKLEVTLKINKTDISRILHTFERFSYTVTASYNESEFHKDLKDRYDEFMRFLNT